MHAHDTADNINTLLWAPSVSQRTSYETSMDSAYTQLIGPLIYHASSSYRHKFFCFTTSFTSIQPSFVKILTKWMPMFSSKLHLITYFYLVLLIQLPVIKSIGCDFFPTNHSNINIIENKWYMLHELHKNIHTYIHLCTHGHTLILILILISFSGWI